MIKYFTMGNSSSTNAFDEKVAKIQEENGLAKTKLECATREKIELARVTLEEKKLDCEMKLKMEKLKLEEKQSTMHAEKQFEAMSKFLEKGCGAEDFVMLAAMSYMTLKEEHTSEESERMGNIVEHMIVRKQNDSGSGHQNQGTRSPPPQYNTGGESGESSEEERTDNRLLNQQRNEVLALKPTSSRQ